MTSVLWFSAFSKTILPTHYLAQGMTFVSMAWATFLFLAAQVVFLLLVRRAGALWLWKVSLFTTLVSFLLIIRLANVFQFYLSQIIAGISMSTFWVAYNTAYFGATPKEKTGMGSAIMFSVFPPLNIIAPPFAGYLIQSSPLAFWMLSLVFLFASYAMIRKQEYFVVSYTMSAALTEIKATRIFLVIEGIWEAMVFAIIPIYTLYFIPTSVSYGLFASYLAIMGIAANLLLGHATDKLQKRVVFLYPLTLLMVLTTFLFPLAAKNVAIWLILTGVLNFLVPLFWNITTAMIVDAHPNLKLAIPGREFTLALGRTVGLAATAISFFLEPTPRIIYYVLGGILFLYPMYLFWISRVKKHYAFL